MTRRSPHENRYNRQPVRVLMNGGAVDCLTYLARPEDGKHVPSQEYMAAIIRVPRRMACRRSTWQGSGSSYLFKPVIPAKAGIQLPFL